MRKDLMVRRYEYGNMYVIVGLAILILGSYKFIWHIALIVMGLLLIKTGLQMQGKPSIGWFIRDMLSHFNR